jgi:hypothetical protein
MRTDQQVSSMMEEYSIPQIHDTKAIILATALIKIVWSPLLVWQTRIIHNTYVPKLKKKRKTPKATNTEHQITNQEAQEQENERPFSSTLEETPQSDLYALDEYITTSYRRKRPLRFTNLYPTPWRTIVHSVLSPTLNLCTQLALSSLGFSAFNTPLPYYAYNAVFQIVELLIISPIQTWMRRGWVGEGYVYGNWWRGIGLEGFLIVAMNILAGVSYVEVDEHRDSLL